MDHGNPLGGFVSGTTADKPGQPIRTVADAVRFGWDEGSSERKGGTTVIPIIVSTLIASLVGSAHCIGMCGPFAMLAAVGSRNHETNSTGMQVRKSRGMIAASSLLPVVAYHVGRLVIYLVFGILAGILGTALDLTGEWIGLQQGAIVLAGGFLILTGLIGLARLFAQSSSWLQKVLPFSSDAASSWLTRFLRRRMGAIQSLTPIRRSFTIGLLTSLMPCGWLYFFVVAASTTQSILLAPLVMAVFWLGTLPALSAVALGATALFAGVRRNINWMIPVMMVLVGTFTIFNRSVISVAAVQRPGNRAPLAATLSSADSSQVPCSCHESP